MALGARLPAAPAAADCAMIATYTLVDAHGARQSGNALSYTLWLFLLSGIPLPLWALYTSRRRGAGLCAPALPLGLAGGVGTTASYAMALWGHDPGTGGDGLGAARILDPVRVADLGIRAARADSACALAGSGADRRRCVGTAAGVREACQPRLAVSGSAGRWPAPFSVTTAASPAGHHRPARSPSPPRPRGPVRPGSAGGVPISLEAFAVVQRAAWTDALRGTHAVPRSPASCTSAQQLTTQPTRLRQRIDADVQYMCLIGRDAEHPIADQLAIAPMARPG